MNRTPTPEDAARDAARRSAELGARSERNVEETRELRFGSRQARTVAQMLRFLRREKQGP